MTAVSGTVEFFYFICLLVEKKKFLKTIMCYELSSLLVSEKKEVREINTHVFTDIKGELLNIKLIYL